MKIDIKLIEQDIIRNYKSGMSIDSIGKLYHIDPRRVRRLLVENNIELMKGGNKNNAVANKDKIIEYYKNGLSIRKIQSLYKTTHKAVSDLLKDNGIEVRDLETSLKSDNVNNEFFKVIDTEAKAYILGLAYADGSISPDRKVKTNYVFSIGFKEGDEYILNDIKKAMNSNHTLTYISRKSGYESDNGFYRLAISSKEIYNDLFALGMDTKKEFPRIPEHLIHHFIRGVFDGDGYISISKRGDVDMGILGELEFLNKLNSYIEFNEPIFERGIHRVRKSGKLNAIKFSNYIYKDATIYLKRKYDKFCCLEPSLQKTLDD